MVGFAHTQFIVSNNNARDFKESRALLLCSYLFNLKAVRLSLNSSFLIPHS